MFQKFVYLLQSQKKSHFPYIFYFKFEIPALISMSTTKIRVFSKITPHLNPGENENSEGFKGLKCLILAGAVSERMAEAASEDSFLSPPSFSLTETDREYYNIVRTEDGISQYYKKYFQKLSDVCVVCVVSSMFFTKSSKVNQSEWRKRSL